jgi:hypothetical protein
MTQFELGCLLTLLTPYPPPPVEPTVSRPTSPVAPRGALPVPLRACFFLAADKSVTAAGFSICTTAPAIAEPAFGINSPLPNATRHPNLHRCGIFCSLVVPAFSGTGTSAGTFVAALDQPSGYRYGV